MAKTKSTVTKSTTTVAPKTTTAAKPQTAAAEPKKEEVKKAPAPKKAPAKTSAKAPAAKATADKTAKKETPVKSSITLQINGIDFDPLKIQSSAIEAAKKIKSDVKDVKVYIKADESAAYFTVDGEGSGDYKIKL
ncbi:hypothetical protein UYO_2653 [Lachnospiraceae bacterium JC7]|nr:hypothetical protein UYO_2653 [Lachnospiraceae bacterium JC7]